MTSQDEVMKQLKKFPSSLDNFDESLIKYKKTMMIACSGNPKLFSKMVNLDRETILEFSKKSNIHIPLLPTQFFKDEEILLNILSRYPSSYLYVCQSLRNNKEFFLKCFYNNIRVLKYSQFSCNKEFVGNLMKINFNAFKFSKVQDDKDLFLEYLKNVRKISSNFLYKSLKRDREFILKGVKINGRILRMVDKEFKKDDEIHTEAVKNDGSCINYPCENKEIILCSVRNPKSGFLYLDKSFQKDEEVQQEALKYKESLIMNLKYDLNQDVDQELLIKCLRMNPVNITKNFEMLRNDEELMMEAIKSNHKSFKNASTDLKFNKKFVKFAMKVNGECLKYVPQSLKMDKEIVMLAVKSNGYALKFAPKVYQDDFEIVKEAILQKNSSIRFASLRLHCNKKLILNARSNILQYLPKEIRLDKEIVWKTKKYHKWIQRIPLDDLNFYFE
jgi:hypothetical protein